MISFFQQKDSPRMDIHPSQEDKEKSSSKSYLHTLDQLAIYSESVCRKSSFRFFPCRRAMNPSELEKPRVTEILVRMDCNGCVQKIKKALHGINGINDMYIDFPQQKLTIIGWADPEKIVKAIRKSRKTATICSHSEHTSPQAQPTEAAPEGMQPPAESANPPPLASPADTSPPAEPPKDDPPPPENLPPPATEAAPPASHPGQSSGPKEVGEVHVIYHHSPDYGYRYSYGPSNHRYGGQGSSVTNAPCVESRNYSAGLGTIHQTPPIYVSHNYNTYKPSPYVTEYVSPLQQYSQPNRPEPPQSPQHVHYNRTEPAQSYSSTEPPQHMNYSRAELQPQGNYSRHDPPKYMHYSRQEPPHYSYNSTPEQPQKHTYYTRPEQYIEDYRNGNGNITSVFSDENPNACTIV